MNFLTDFPQRAINLCASISDVGYCESRVSVVTPATPQPLQIPLPTDLITVVGTEGELGARLADDLLAYLRPDICPDLRLKLDPVSTRETPAGQTASGQTGVYIEARLTLGRQDSTDTVALVGNGRGPAAFEDAYGNLLDSAVDGISAAAPDCVKGSTQ